MRFRVGTLVLGGGLVAASLSGCGAGDRGAAEAPGGAAVSGGAKVDAAGIEPTVTAAPVDADPRVGAVFLGGGTTHSCSGSVLHSTTGDLVLTAAHCLATGLAAGFVPGFAETAEPSQVWNVDTVYLDPRWVATQDPLADYAIVRVSRPDGGSVEAVAGGALTLGTTPQPGTAVSVTGYTLGVGGAPLSCRTVTGLAPGGFPSLQCGGLADGTSGAPWVTGSTVTGLTGGLDGGGCDENISYSPPFDENTARLLARAEAGGPGDSAPNTFDSQC